MKSKTQRLKVVRSLIMSQKISNQEDLQALLEKQGFNVTQATLSRDLKELKIAKAPDGEFGYRYKLPELPIDADISPDSADFPIMGIKSIEFSGSMAVIKTRPGFASVAAAIIDSSVTREIMGTLAGDDTVLLIIRQGMMQEQVLQSISAFIPGVKDKLI